MDVKLDMCLKFEESIKQAQIRIDNTEDKSVDAINSPLWNNTLDKDDIEKMDAFLSKIEKWMPAYRLFGGQKFVINVG